MSRTFGLALILRDPDLRLIAGLMTLQGAFVCTLGPYLSVLAVRQFGLGDRGYAVVMVASTLVAGTALMTAAPGAVSFVVAHAVILPLSSLYGQLFAQARLAAQRAGPQGDGAATRDGIMSTIRALMALVTVAGALGLVWVDRRSAG